MDQAKKTRIKAGAGGFAAVIFQIALPDFVAQHPMLRTFLLLAAVGALVFVLKPELAHLHLWGKRKPSDSEEEPGAPGRTGIRSRRGKLKMSGSTKITQQDTGLDLKDTDTRIGGDLDIQ